MRNLWMLLLCCATAAHAEAPKQQLGQTLEQLAKSRENAKRIEQQLSATTEDLEALQAKAAELAAHVQASERRVSTQEDSLAVVNKKLARKQADFEARKAEYAATVTSLLRMQALPPTAIFTSPENIHQLMRTASALEKTNQAIAAKALQLKHDMADLKMLQGDAKARDARTRIEQKALSAEQKNLARELAKRKALQAQLSDDRATAEREVEALSRQSASLQELLDKLETSERNRASTANTVKASGTRTAAKKGSLRSPVAGSILHHFGDRKNANETYRGMVFRTRPGATVVAPHDGEIVFTGPFRDYGTMVLIKHGNGLISLIAGLGSVSAALNQPAVAGEPIGTMPGVEGAEAYVELRDKEAKPIDPAEWFANVAGKRAAN